MSASEPSAVASSAPGLRQLPRPSRVPHTSATLAATLEYPLRITSWVSVAALFLFGAWYGVHTWYHVQRYTAARLAIVARFSADAMDLEVQAFSHRIDRASTLIAPHLSSPYPYVVQWLQRAAAHNKLPGLTLATGSGTAVLRLPGEDTFPAQAGRARAWRRAGRGLMIGSPQFSAATRAWSLPLRKQFVGPHGTRFTLTTMAPLPVIRGRNTRSSISYGIRVLPLLGRHSGYARGKPLLAAREPLAGFPLTALTLARPSLLWAIWWRETRILFAFLAVSIAATAWIHRRTILRQRLWQEERESAARALAREKELAEVTLQSIADAVIVTDVTGRITSMNAVAEQLTGYRTRDALGTPLAQVFRTIDETTRMPAPDLVSRALSGGEVTELTRVILAARHGEEYVIEHSAAPIRNTEKQILGAVLVFHDVTDRHRLTDALIHQARHDYLTGLPNRQTLEDALDQACRSITADVRHILIYLDLDQLKVINDSCGHAAGDDLLRQVAKILGMHVRTTDIVARLGGDEFGVLLHRCDLTRGQMVAENLLHAIRSHRFIWNEKIFVLSASLGLVVLDSAMAEAAGAMSAADSACYLAKEQGRNRVCVHTASDQAVSRYREGMNWVNEVTEALEHNRLRLYRQKIVSTGNRETIEYEVLMRLVRANGEIVKPSLFIPSVERYGIMPNLDRWVIRTLLRHLDTAETDGGDHYAVNISGTSLNDDFFLDFVLEHLNTAHVDRIRFEITETAAITNFPRAQHFIAQLRGKGCRFSLDDFGSGLSSFAYLRNLAIDSIKIDGSFIKDLAMDPVAHAIVRSINQVAHDMGLKTVAEFVDDDGALALLEAMGVDHVQGFAIHRPEPIPPVST
ncbi:MAG: EAL domain-containing protein [Acidiferrobacteraceae bacterium]